MRKWARFDLTWFYVVDPTSDVTRGHSKQSFPKTSLKTSLVERSRWSSPTAYRLRALTVLSSSHVSRAHRCFVRGKGVPGFVEWQPLDVARLAPGVLLTCDDTVVAAAQTSDEPRARRNSSTPKTLASPTRSDFPTHQFVGWTRVQSGLTALVAWALVLHNVDELIWLLTDTKDFRLTWINEGLYSMKILNENYLNPRNSVTNY